MLSSPPRRRIRGEKSAPSKRVSATTAAALRVACESLEPRRLLASSLHAGFDTSRAIFHGPRAAASAAPARNLTAQAIPVSTNVVTATARPVGQTGSPSPSVTAGIVYSNLGGASATAVTLTGSGAGTEIGFDDYNTINDADLNMTHFAFWGGVGLANQQLFFDFHDAANVFIVRIGVQLPQGGGSSTNFIWDVPLNPGVEIPDTGFLHVIAPAGVQGR